MSNKEITNAERVDFALKTLWSLYNDAKQEENIVVRKQKALRGINFVESALKAPVKESKKFDIRLIELLEFKHLFLKLMRKNFDFVQEMMNYLKVHVPLHCHYLIVKGTPATTVAFLDECIAVVDRKSMDLVGSVPPESSFLFEEKAVVCRQLKDTKGAIKAVKEAYARSGGKLNTIPGMSMYCDAVLADVRVQQWDLGLGLPDFSPLDLEDFESVIKVARVGRRTCKDRSKDRHIDTELKENLRKRENNFTKYLSLIGALKADISAKRN